MKILNQFTASRILQPSTLLVLGTLFFFVLSTRIPSGKALGVVALGLIAFYAGEWISLRSKFKAKISMNSLRYTGAFLFVVSLIALYFDFYTAGGIPLFNSALRRFLSPLLTSVAFLMVPGMLFLLAAFAKEKHARLYSVFLIGFTVSMMALLGFRTQVLAALLGALIAAYYLEIFSKKQLGALVLLAILAFSGMSVMRTGDLGFSERATLTVGAFNTLVDETPLFGLTHGFVEFADLVKLLSPSPVYGGRTLVSTIIGLRTGASTTSTLFGPPFVDFGVLGASVFLLFGLILGLTYNAVRANKNFAPFHALLLPFLLLGIETGIADAVIWAYFLLTALVLGWLSYGKA